MTENAALDVDLVKACNHQALVFPTQKEERWRRTAVPTVAELLSLHVTDYSESFLLGQSLGNGDAGPMESDRGGCEIRVGPQGAHTIPSVAAQRAGGVTIEPLFLARGRRASVRSSLLKTLRDDERLCEWNRYVDAPGVYVSAMSSHGASVQLTHELNCQVAVGATTCIFEVPSGHSLVLVERFLGQQASEKVYFSELRVVLQPGSQLTHLRLGRSSRDSRVFDTLNVEVGEGSSYSQRQLLLPGAQFRSTQNIDLLGVGASASLRTSAIASRGADVDVDIEVNHGNSKTTSETVVHALTFEGSKASFSSLASVPKAVSKVQAKQMLKGLMQGHSADLAIRPRLKAQSDDVQCVHGATTSAIRPEEYFFLQCRGLSRKDAQNTLMNSFLLAGFGELSEELHRHEFNGEIGKVLNQRDMGNVQ